MSFKVNWSLINISHHKLLTSYFPLSITFTIEFFISKPMFCESGVPPLGVVIFMFATKIEKKKIVLIVQGKKNFRGLIY